MPRDFNTAILFQPCHAPETFLPTLAFLSTPLYICRSLINTCSRPGRHFNPQNQCHLGRSSLHRPLCLLRSIYRGDGTGLERLPGLCGQDWHRGPLGGDRHLRQIHLRRQRWKIYSVCVRHGTHWGHADRHSIDWDTAILCKRLHDRPVRQHLWRHADTRQYGRGRY